MNQEGWNNKSTSLAVIRALTGCGCAIIFVLNKLLQRQCLNKVLTKTVFKQTVNKDSNKLPRRKALNKPPTRPAYNR